MKGFISLSCLGLQFLTDFSKEVADDLRYFCRFIEGNQDFVLLHLIDVKIYSNFNLVFEL
jgi:hypothetical protein